MTRGANLRDRDRYRREVREPLTALTAWLPQPWSSSTMRLQLAAIMAAAPTLDDIGFKASPAQRNTLVPCRLRVTVAQRGMIDLIARLHGVAISEALRGILAAWMEVQP